jgi:hypothetical protein
MRRLPLLLALLLALVRGGPAAAEEAAEPAATVAKIQELLKAKDEAGLKEAVAKVPEMHNASEDAAAKASLADALGDVAKDKKAGEARQAAVEALAQLDEKKNAWKQLKGLMPDTKVEEAQPLDLAVVKAAGVVAEDGAIPLLVELGEKAKSTPLAKEAVMSLGGYTGASKKKKVEILDTVLSLAVRIKPSSGGSSNKAVSPQAQERFSEVGTAVVETANKLTGRKVPWEEWELLYKDHKKNLGKLLPDE